MQTKAIKQKIKSTGSIKKITRTMEMVSVAKMKKALGIADGYKAFLEEAKNILSILSDAKLESVYTQKNNSNKTLIIIIAGQKGLCGGFNTNIYKEVNSLVRSIAGHSFDFISVNKYAEKIAKKFIRNDEKLETKNQNVLLASYIEKKITPTHIHSVLKTVIAGYVEKKYSQVYVVYTDFTNVNTQKVQSFKLLPFSEEKIDKIKKTTQKVNTNNYLFEPTQSDVYDKAISLVLHHVVSAAIERSLAAEHAARMMAMKTATDNASDMLGDLKLYYNKVRQAAITQEIAEISSGAMALAK